MRRVPRVFALLFGRVAPVDRSVAVHVCENLDDARRSAVGEGGVGSLGRVVIASAGDGEQRECCDMALHRVLVGLWAKRMERASSRKDVSRDAPLLAARMRSFVVGASIVMIASDAAARTSSPAAAT